MANFFGINLPIPQFSLPKISPPSLPKVSVPSLPKVTVPSLPKISVPSLPKVTVPSLPKVEVPKVSLPTLPKGDLPLPKVDLPKVTLPDLPKVSLPKIALPELPKPAAGPAGGNIIDTIINARDKSYSDSTEHIAAGNIAGGGAQFAGTAAADVLLPMDLADAANKWMTGRGDQIDGELALWAAIDAVTLAAAPFTFGASYAAGRAAKAAKVAGKTAKVGGEMGKSTAITKAIGAFQGVGKTSKVAKTAGTTKTAIKPLKVAAPGKVTSNTSNISAAMRKQAEAAQKQYASLQKQMQAQYSKMMSSLKAPKSAPVGASKGLGAAGKTSNLSKTGTALKTAGTTLGVGAIGLTALGALGGPVQAQEVPPGYDPGYDPGILPGFEFPEIPGFEPPTWEEYPYPDGDGGYTDENGYYPPGYPDFLGLEDYGQGLFGAAEEVPVVGGLAHAIRSRGLTVPVLIGVLVLAILFLRSKKGKAMIAGAKKKVSGATKSAKKAVKG